MQTKNLILRRTRLRQLINDLSEELNFVESEIQKENRSKPRSIDQAFFYNAVLPLLKEAGKKGLTTAEIRDKLNKSGIEVKPSNLRVLLSRMKSRDTITQTKKPGARGKWILDELEGTLNG